MIELEDRADRGCARVDRRKCRDLHRAPGSAARHFRSHGAPKSSAKRLRMAMNRRKGRRSGCSLASAMASSASCPRIRSASGSAKTKPALEDLVRRPVSRRAKRGHARLSLLHGSEGRTRGTACRAQENLTPKTRSPIDPSSISQAIRQAGRFLIAAARFHICRIELKLFRLKDHCAMSRRCELTGNSRSIRQQGQPFQPQDAHALLAQPRPGHAHLGFA